MQTFFRLISINKVRALKKNDWNVTNVSGAPRQIYYLKKQNINFFRPKLTCKLSFSLAVDKAKPFRGNVWHFKVTNFFKSISICISSSFWFIESCWCSKTSSTNFITTMKFGQWPILVACQHNTWPMQLTTFHILHDEKIDGIFQQTRWATRLKSSSLKMLNIWPSITDGFPTATSSIAFILQNNHQIVLK